MDALTMVKYFLPDQDDIIDRVKNDEQFADEVEEKIEHIVGGYYEPCEEPYAMEIMASNLWESIEAESLDEGDRKEIGQLLIGKL